MKDILDILKKTPICKLADIDTKLPGLVVKALDLMPVGTKYSLQGQRDIYYFHSSLAYGQRRLLGWTHERMVNEGEARWVK